MQINFSSVFKTILNSTTAPTSSTAPTAATAPTANSVAIAVSNIAVTSVSTNSISISFTPPSSGTIVWNYRVHGNSAWTPYNTAFSSNTGTFTGLNSNTVYDIQAVVSLNNTTAASELDNITTQSSTPVNASTTFAAINAYDNGQTFSRDANANTGNPSGYNTTYNAGWATIPFTVTLKNAGNGTPQIRLRDSANPGTYSSPGTIIQNWLTIPGAPTTFTTAPTQINAIIPASKRGYIVDIAFSGDLANGITSANPIWVGVNVMVFGQSLATGFFDTYGYTPPTGDLSAIWTPQPYIHMLSQGTDSIYSNGFKPVGQETWFNPINGSQSYGNTTMCEFYNKVADFENCAVGALGFCQNGTPISTFDPNISSPSDGRQTQGWATMETILNRVNNIDLLLIVGCNTNSDGGPYNNASYGEYAVRVANIIEAVKNLTTKPFYISEGVTFNPDDNTGRQGYELEIQNKVMPKYNGLMKIFKGRVSVIGGYPNAGGHPSWTQRQQVAYNYAHEYSQLTGRNPNIQPYMVSATRANGSADVYITVNNTGSALVGDRAYNMSSVDATERVTTYAPSVSAAELSTGFSVFPATGGLLTGELTVSTVNIISATQLKLTLSAVPTGSLELWYKRFNTPQDGNYIGAISVRNNVVDALTARGKQLESNITAIYVSDPSINPNTSIAITKVNGATANPNVQSNAKVTISGTWDGNTMPTLIEYSIDGGAWRSPIETYINTSKTWSSAFSAPASIGNHNITVRLNGSIAGNTFAFNVVYVDLPLPNVKLDIDPRVIGTMSSDVNKTLGASHLTLVKSITDNSGNGNDFYAPDRAPRLYYGLRNSLPGLMFSLNSADARYQPISSHRFTYLQNVAGSTLSANLFNKSFSMLIVTMEESDGVAFCAANSQMNIATQNFVVGMNNSNPAIRRDSSAQYNIGNTFDNSLNDTTKDYRFIIKKMFIRFDVSSKTLKMKVSGNSEVSMTMNFDPSVYTAWDQCYIGLFYNNYASGLNGALYRLAISPNYVASDSERDNTLAYADNLYGS